MIAFPERLVRNATCVNLRECANAFVDEESLAYRCGVGHARCLYDDPIELILPLLQLLEYRDEVPAHRAAHAAIGHVEHDFVLFEL